MRQYTRNEKTELSEEGEDEEEKKCTEDDAPQNLERGSSKKNTEAAHLESDSSSSHISANNKLPWICLKEGLSQKASISNPSSWVKLSLTLDGRDKITKVLQYSSRLLFFYTQQECFLNLQKSLTSSRKAYRLGRTFTEMIKLYQLQLWNLFFIMKEHTIEKTNRELLRKISSNIGLAAPFGNFARLSSFYVPSPSPKVTESITKILLALKLLGLAGFWFGDNVTYLSSIGFLSSEKKASSQLFATRSYFFAATIGLVTNVRLILLHRSFNNSIRIQSRRIDWEKVKQKQFSLVVALLKSCCDVLVFSNNPGVDLHTKYRGTKMHEAFHCLFGLISASAVLLNNFPNVDN